MAQIDVQKKKANPLPWVIIILLVLAVAGYLVCRNMHHPAPANTTTTDTTTTRTDTMQR